MKEQQQPQAMEFRRRRRGAAAWMCLRVLVLGGLSAAAIQPSFAAETVTWRAGVARTVITPSESMWMAGYAARDKPSQGKVHDLFAKALALEADGSRLVIVTADLIGIPRTVADRVLADTARKYGLSESSLLLNASHTHCGPEIRPEKAYFYGISDLEAEKIVRYAEALDDTLVELIGRALEDVRPVDVAAGRSLATFARNRRAARADGFAMAQNNDGPVDHEVPVLKVSDKAGRLRAVLFGYACHNTTLSINEFCGDYAGFAQRTIEAAHPGATALFMIGAGGDQNPYPRRELEHAERHGLELGDAVNRAMDRPMTPIAVGLRTARDNALLDFAPLPPQSELDAWTTSKNVRERLKGRYLLERLDKGPPLEMSYALPIQVAQFGGQLLMIAIGGEVVVDYSRRLKTQLAGKRQVWVAGYSNDIFGYLPSRRVLLEGGYEGGGAMLYQPLPGPFTDTVEDRVLSTVHRLVGRVSVAQ